MNVLGKHLLDAQVRQKLRIYVKITNKVRSLNQFIVEMFHRLKLIVVTCATPLREESSEEKLPSLVPISVILDQATIAFRHKPLSAPGRRKLLKLLRQDSNLVHLEHELLQ